MKKKCEFTVGDIVFARVRGYPHWPARITTKRGKQYQVFFYGTYEKSTFLKAKELVPYSQEHKREFSNKYIKQCGYAEGLEEIENNPDIAFGNYDHEANSEKDSESVTGNSPTILVEKSPEKFTQLVQMDKTNTPAGLKPKSTEKFTKLVQMDKTDTPAGSRSEKREANILDDFHSQIAKRTVSEEMVVGDKYSRSFQKLKPSNKWDNEKELNVQRSIWATDKQTGDLVELPVDKDRPAQFESEAQKLEWEMSAARKALMLKKQIEDGVKIPDSSATAKIEDKSDRKEEKIESETIEDNLAYLTKRKIMLQSLRVEKKLEDLHVSIKNALHLTNPQPMRGLELLEEFLEIPLNSLSLKKHSHVVNLIKRLRKYAGPDRMSPQDEISEFVPLIKQKAEEIYQKIKMAFNYVEKDLDDDQGFHEEFTRQVGEFEEKTKLMEVLEIVELISDPTDETKLS